MQFYQTILFFVFVIFMNGQIFSQSENLVCHTLFYVNDSALVHINGNATFTQSTASLVNKGIITTKDDANRGSFIIKDSAVVQGNGFYEVEGDWINRATFLRDSSWVKLQGINQLITGDSITHFFRLELLNAGVKTQTLDAYTHEQLLLNHLELATNSHWMYVTNPSVTSVQNTQVFNGEGMVSSTGNGRLHREMNVSSTYLYPLGSSLITRRYRPLEVKPSSNVSQGFATRLANNNPTLDGYDVTKHDSLLCRVNDRFYHLIERVSGSSPVDLEFYYLPTLDGPLDESVQLNTPQVNKWNSMGASANTYLNFTGVRKSSWSDFSENPFALAKFTPLGPLVTGDLSLCDTNATFSYTVNPSLNNTTYTWSPSSSINLLSGQGQSTAIINMPSNGSGVLSLVATDNFGCSSYPSVLNITQSNVVASFDTIGNALIGSVNAINTSTGATNYFWDFGDGFTSTNVNETHQFLEVGYYQIILFAENDFGCSDYDTLLVSVDAGVIIPNVFTPNSDGVNDFFAINSVGMISQELTIFNRWGKQVYFSDDTIIKWFGQIKNNEAASEGTYYYLYKAKSSKKEYEYNGALMLLR